MNILYTLNDKFVPQVAGGICSICENNKDVDDINFYLISNGISEENKNQHMDPDRIILRDLTKNLQVIVTFGHPSRRKQEIILKENQPVNFFGIDFVLRKGILYAKRDEEEKIFLSPGSYYINISPIIKGTWESGKTFIPFEGKHHPKQ